MARMKQPYTRIPRLLTAILKDSAQPLTEASRLAAEAKYLTMVAFVKEPNTKGSRVGKIRQQKGCNVFRMIVEHFGNKRAELWFICTQALSPTSISDLKERNMLNILSSWWKVQICPQGLSQIACALWDSYRLDGLCGPRSGSDLRSESSSIQGITLQNRARG